MDEQTEPSKLADMMAVKFDGPALVFLRPREHIPGDMLARFADHFKRARDNGDLADFAHVKFVFVPHGFDVMVMGDVELERAGLARLTPEPA